MTTPPPRDTVASRDHIDHARQAIRLAGVHALTDHTDSNPARLLEHPGPDRSRLRHRSPARQPPRPRASAARQRSTPPGARSAGHPRRRRRPSTASQPAAARPRRCHQPRLRPTASAAAVLTTDPTDIPGSLRRRAQTVAPVFGRGRAPAPEHTGRTLTAGASPAVVPEGSISAAVGGLRAGRLSTRGGAGIRAR